MHGDMRNFDFERTFALVTIPFRAFQHLLTVEDQIACLTCVRRHMADDGRFIVDVFNPSLEMLVNKELGEEFDSDPLFPLPDGRTVQRRARIIERNRFTQVNDCEDSRLHGLNTPASNSQASFSDAIGRRDRRRTGRIRVGGLVDTRARSEPTSSSCAVGTVLGSCRCLT